MQEGRQDPGVGVEVGCGAGLHRMCCPFLALSETLNYLSP